MIYLLSFCASDYFMPTALFTGFICTKQRKVDQWYTRRTAGERGRSNTNISNWPRGSVSCAQEAGCFKGRIWCIYTVTRVSFRFDLILQLFSWLIHKNYIFVDYTCTEQTYYILYKFVMSTCCLLQNERKSWNESSQSIEAQWWWCNHASIDMLGALMQVSKLN